MPPSSDKETTINVIGTDASGLEHLPSHLEKLVLSAKSLAAPKRLLSKFPSWWDLKCPGKELPELINSEEPDRLINWLHKKKGFSSSSRKWRSTLVWDRKTSF